MLINRTVYTIKTYNKKYMSNIGHSQYIFWQQLLAKVQSVQVDFGK